MSPERLRIAKIFKAHIEKAIEALGKGYMVYLFTIYPNEGNGTATDIAKQDGTQIQP
jgi:hypothetical protein